MALWERYNRSALEGLAGVDTYVLDYESVVADRDRSIAALTTWLGSLEQFEGASAGWDTTAAARRRSTAGSATIRVIPPGEGSGIVLTEQRQLIDRLGRRPAGTGRSCLSRSAPSPAWTTSLLRLRRELSGPRRELDATKDRLRIARKELESTRPGWPACGRRPAGGSPRRCAP